MLLFHILILCQALLCACLRLLNLEHPCLIVNAMLAAGQRGSLFAAFVTGLFVSDGSAATCWAPMLRCLILPQQLQDLSVTCYVTLPFNNSFFPRFLAAPRFHTKPAGCLISHHLISPPSSLLLPLLPPRCRGDHPQHFLSECYRSNLASTRSAVKVVC